MQPAITAFDFLIGTWQVRHHRLKARLAGCTEWESFQGSCVARSILGGAGNLDDNVLEMPSGTYRAASLRTYDPVADLWSIWWLDGRHPGRLDPPVVGGFKEGVGTFFADDILAGTPIRVRFRWTGTDTTSPLWEQAFSADDGASWEANWTMAFSRDVVSEIANIDPRAGTCA